MHQLPRLKIGKGQGKGILQPRICMECLWHSLHLLFEVRIPKSSRIFRKVAGRGNPIVMVLGFAAGCGYLRPGCGYLRPGCGLLRAGFYPQNTENLKEAEYSKLELSSAPKYRFPPFPTPSLPTHWQSEGFSCARSLRRSSEPKASGFTRASLFMITREPITHEP